MAKLASELVFQKQFTFTVITGQTERMSVAIIEANSECMAIA
jgi:hypothetical protein